MGLFDNTAKRLATRPAVLFAVDPAGLANTLTSYDLGMKVRSDRIVFGNGVLLYGPVEITPETVTKAGAGGVVTDAYGFPVTRPEDLLPR